MKKITELTEQEIYLLTDDEINIMIRLRKAEEGIRLMERPTIPTYFEITPPDMVVYGCKLFDSDLTFKNPEDIQSVVTLIRSLDNKFRIDYDYGKTDGNVKFASTQLSKYSSTEDVFVVSTQSVYSMGLYNKVIDMVAQNKKLKDAYDKDNKAYETAISESKWIEDEIRDAVAVVREKIWKLESLCRKFRFDYMPIAQENETIAMGFLDKAYSLTDEQKEYVIANYKTVA
jgi:hypothetical protein